MTLALGLTLGAIVGLLIVSAFFSGSETALTAASRARMHALEDDGSARAGLVNRLLESRERLIGALLLGNNLVNIAASALTTSLFLSVFGDAGVAYATLVMTAVVVVFAEVLPKTYAILNADRMALAVAPVLKVLVALLAPVTAALQFLVRHTLRLFGANIDDDAEVLSAHEEIRGAIELHHKEGGVVKGDRDMLGGVLDLRDLDVSDIMVHRTNMVTIDADLSPEEIIDQALQSSHTRIPLWKGEREEIVGILHARTLLQALRDSMGDIGKIDVMALATKPWFVPDTTTLKAQLAAFLKRKNHFAIVVDEYGEVMGLWMRYREVLGLEFTEVRYEQLVSDTSGEARRVIGFLGEAWDDAVLEYRSGAKERMSTTPGAEAVARPVYDSSIGRWKRYAHRMGPAMEALTPFVESFGYETA